MYNFILNIYFFVKLYFKEYINTMVYKQALKFQPSLKPPNAHRKENWRLGTVYWN